MIEDERDPPERFAPRAVVHRRRRSSPVVRPLGRPPAVEAAPTGNAGGHDADPSGALTADGSVHWSDLHAFQRDVLLVVAALENRHPYGRQIKERLDEEYGEDVVGSRLYQALDALVELDLVRKRRGTRDARMNYYSLTTDAGRLLEAHTERCASVVGLDVAPRTTATR